MTWKDFDELASSHGVGLVLTTVACMGLVLVVYKVAMKLLSIYDIRLEASDERDDKRITAIENIVETQRTLCADNKKLTESVGEIGRILDRMSRGDYNKK